MKILLVPSNPGWAFDHRARDLMSLRMKGIRFRLKYLREVEPKDRYEYDLIYPLTLDGAKILKNRSGIPYRKMAAGITSLRSIESYRKEGGRFDSDFIKFIKSLRGVNTASDEIVRLFDKQCKVHKTRVGIDDKLFKPASSPPRNKTFTVGWVGRIDKPDYRELKGYDIALSALKGLDAKLKIRTYKENYVPRHKMVSFYQGLDCFLCTSWSEHIPLPILEAAACGVPIITTKVGIVPELIKSKENGIIVSRTPDAIRQAVRHLKENEKERKALGLNVRKTIVSHWTLESCKADWEAFFKSMAQER
jgi:Glycosyltransferase